MIVYIVIYTSPEGDEALEVFLEESHASARVEDLRSHPERNIPLSRGRTHGKYYYQAFTVQDAPDDAN